MFVADAKPHPYTIVVPDEVLEVVESQSGNAKEKRNMAAIITLLITLHSSNEPFPLCA